MIERGQKIHFYPSSHFASGGKKNASCWEQQRVSHNHLATPPSREEQQLAPTAFGAEVIQVCYELLQQTGRVIH